jgi:hypothetical protein
MGANPLVSPDDAQHWVCVFGYNDLVTDNNVGSLGLQITNIANAPTLALQTAGKYGTVQRITTAATANGDGWAIHSFPDGLVLSPGMIAKAKVRYPVELASMNFRFGLDDSVTATRPTVGVTFESDAGVLDAHTDSADHGDEGIAWGQTMVVGQWYILEIRLHGENAQGGPRTADFYVDGRLVASLPCPADDDEEVEFKLVGWQDSGGGDAVTFEVAWMELYIPNLAD